MQRQGNLREYTGKGVFCFYRLYAFVTTSCSFLKCATWARLVNVSAGTATPAALWAKKLGGCGFPWSLLLATCLRSLKSVPFL
jgi:hypothetical protein